MSEIIGRTTEDYSKRKLEAKASSGKSAKAKMVVATLWKNFAVEPTRRAIEAIEDVTKQKIVSLFLKEDALLEPGDDMRGRVRAQLQQSLRMMKALNRVGKVCSPQKFENAEWVYAWNYFSEHIDFGALDKNYKQEKWWSHAWYFAKPEHMDHLLARYDEQISLYVHRLEELKTKEEFTGEKLTPDEEFLIKHYTQKLQSNDLNPLVFDADPRIASAMLLMTEELILGDFEMDPETIQNIQAAIELSVKTGKKLVLNCNHAGHSDSYVIQLWYNYLMKKSIILGKNLPPEEKKILRFLWGFYMTVTPGIRHYHLGINSVTVPGLNDMDAFRAGLWVRWTARVFGKTMQWWKADAHNEIWVIFSQWWRGDYGGLKHGVVEGTQRYFPSDVIVVDVHFTNTDKIYAAMANKVATFNRWTAQKVAVKVGKPYVWWTKSSEQMFADMVEQRDAMQPEWKGAEKVHVLLQKIAEVEKTSRPHIDAALSALALADIPDIEFLETQTQASPKYIAEKKHELYVLQNALSEAECELNSLKDEYSRLLVSWEVWKEAAKIAL
jgi:hypothetical protein